MITLGLKSELFSLYVIVKNKDKNGNQSTDMRNLDFKNIHYRGNIGLFYYPKDDERRPKRVKVDFIFADLE